ncbi:Rhodanese like domain [Trypanosoma vivax]|nr:Rhodanese like domain [Trypanosoma vivax]
MEANYKYMDAAELVALLDNSDQCEEVAVIDCRDEDRADGWIRGSIHFPAATQNQSKHMELASTLNERGLTIAVFHCALSQVRGPRAAGRFADALRALNLQAPRVYVLRGGFEHFHAMYADSRPDLLCC